MRTITIVLAVGVSLGLMSCSNSGRGRCQKQVDCCGQANRCNEINSEGQGYVERCDIDYQATLDSLGTWSNKACDEIASKLDDYYSCLAGVACTDVAAAGTTDSGHVAKCDTQALAYCNAVNASGDACGVSKKNCDNYQADLYRTH